MKKLFLLPVFAFIAATPSRAQVYYHDISPDTTMGGGPVLQYFTFAPPATYPSFETYWDPSLRIYMEVHGISGYGELLYDNSWPAKLEPGAMIGPTTTGTWVEGHGALNENGDGHWITNAADKYIGFRFKKPTGSAWYYGWLQLTIAPAAASFTVKAWAYQTQAGTAITAGDMWASNIAAASHHEGISINTDNRQLYFSGLKNGISYAITISDMNGRQVQKATAAAGIPVSLQDLPPGIYIIRLSGNEEIHVFRTSIP